MDRQIKIASFNSVITIAAVICTFYCCFTPFTCWPPESFLGNGNPTRCPPEILKNIHDHSIFVNPDWITVDGENIKSNAYLIPYWQVYECSARFLFIFIVWLALIITFNKFKAKRKSG